MDDIKEHYPHLSDDQVQTLKDINASPEQWKASDASAKKNIDRILSNYRHDTGKPLVVLVTGATGAGKSATANTLLGRKAFEEGSAAVSVTTEVQWEDTEYDGMSVIVIDTPGSWETETGALDVTEVDVYVLVINLASPRFGQQQLNELRSPKGSNGQPLLSGRCLVALTHADSTLQMITVNGYLEEIRGDPLHRLLTEDLKGNILAINNTASTEYERQRHQRAIFSVALRAQRRVQRGSALSLLKSGIWWMVLGLRRNRTPKIALIGLFGIAMLFWQQGWIRF